MKRLPFIFLLALAALPLYARTFTNAQGVRVEGEIQKVQDSQGTIKLANGRVVSY